MSFKITKNLTVASPLFYKTTVITEQENKLNTLAPQTKKILNSKTPSRPKDKLSGLSTAQTAGDMEAALETWDQSRLPEERGKDVGELGKALARVRGAELAAQMLDDSDLSLREIHERFDFQPASLSNLRNGNSETGPTLWRLFALAEALGFSLELTAVKRV